MRVPSSMQKLALFVALLLQVCSVSSLLCGEIGHRKKYDKVTHKCTNGTIEPRIPLGEPDNNTATFGGGRLLCGLGREKSRYDTKNQLCCNGTLYSVNSNVSCCLNTPFDKRFNICCGGLLRPKPELNISVTCCGTDPITDKNSLCCDDKLHSKNPSEYGCCGSKPYEVRKDRCCKGTVYKLSEREECCKNRTFNKFDQYCYREQEVLNITDDKCGGAVYNTRVSLCCEGKLHPFAKGVECCKSVTYNRSSQTCADGHVVLKHFSWCKASGENDPRLKEKKGGSWRCCGSELIDYDDYDCCAGKKFNKRNENCCGGRVIQREKTCCARKVLNRTTQVCCDKTLFTEEKIIQKKNIYDDKCCSTWPDGGASYDSVNFVCTMENKIVKKANQRTLCGKEEYNPSHDLCCNSRVFKNASRDGMSCCLPNASIYNPKTHVCCFGVRKKGKRCLRTKHRLRCPRFCRRRKITMRKYCNNFQARNASHEVFENVKKQMKLLQSSKSCRCVYKKKQRKRLCKAKPCRTFKGLVGILVEERREYAKLYLRQKMQNNGIHPCRSL